MPGLNPKRDPFTKAKEKPATAERRPPEPLPPQRRRRLKVSAAELPDVAFGMIETRGLIAAVVSLDAMLKTAPVVLVSQRNTGSGLVAMVVRGDTAAVQAAVEAGRTTAARFQALVSHHVIPRLSAEAEPVTR